MSFQPVIRSARSIGSAAMTMQLRSQKRNFASSTTVTDSSNNVSISTPEKRSVKRKMTSLGTTSVVAPSKSKFPVLTALKQRVHRDSSSHKVLLEYPNLVPARLIRRYKRFLADVVLLDGAEKDGSVGNNSATENDEGEEVNAKEIRTIYCPNTGPMVGLLDGLPNARVQLSKSNDPKRKYEYTLEMIQIHNGERNVWVGVHSTSANRMIEQALTSRWLPELGHYDSVRREVKFAKNSRVDFVLTTYAKDGSVAHEKYVEVKSATLAVDGFDKTSSRCAVFPDTVSTRAQKHVTELTDLLSTKANAQASKEIEKAAPELSGAIIFLVQRDDCNEFTPSTQHDKKFAELCKTAASCGIQLLAYACALEPNELESSGTVRLLEPLPLRKAALS